MTLRSFALSATLALLLGIQLLPIATVSLAAGTDKNADVSTIQTEGLVPCGTRTNPVPCTSAHLFILIKRIINFLLFYLAIPLATIGIAISGGQLLIYGSSPGDRAKASERILNILKGLAIAFGAWLIISVITDNLVDKAVIYVPLKQ